MYVLIGLLIGIGAAMFMPITIPAAYSPYVAIALLGALDSAFGGVTAMLRGRFKLNIFLSGFFGNAILAGIITFVGKQLDLDLFLAAVVVFGTRIFQNFADMRRFLLTCKKKTYKIEEKEKQQD
ncbi:MAG: small basic family protein [Clostridia bacterium]